MDRTRPELERYIARHLQYPEAVPLIFADPLASIREIRGLKITPPTAPTTLRWTSPSRCKCPWWQERDGITLVRGYDRA
jgi:hypothetical protein